MIPKVIHYCWFGGKPLPSDVKKCLTSWRRFCPDYQIICWDETNFDVSQHPFCESAYAQGAWSFVSDWARLKVIYDNGGIYLDTDVELVKNLDFLLDNLCYIGIQQNGRLCNTGLGFGAEKANPVVNAMLDKYRTLKFDVTQMSQLACPFSNHSVFSELGYSYTDEIVNLKDATVYPCRFFDPIAPGKDSENMFCSETVSIHHYSNSWGSLNERVKRKIFNAVGVQRVARLKEILNR